MTLSAQLAGIEDLEPTPAHDWLIERNGAENTPIEIQIALREYVEDLPKTKATFTKKEALDGTDLTYHGIHDKMLHHVGSWLAPVDGNNERWVNPNYEHRHKYTDLLVECECGAKMARLQDDEHVSIDGSHGHTDDCTQQMKYRTKAKLCEKRADIIREIRLSGHSPSKMEKRLNLSGGLGYLYDNLGVDVGELQDEYTEARRNTILHLLKNHDTQTVARAYGISPQRLRGIVSEDSPYTLRQFNNYRKEVR